MKQIQIFLFVLCAFFSFSTSNALIVDTNDFKETFSHHQENILYVFDLDNTLIEAKQHLGSDQWFANTMAELKMKEGLSHMEAFAKFFPVYSEVLNHTEMQFVDPSIFDLLNQMHKKKAAMIGLTKRNPNLSKRTFEQMASLQIDFSASSPSKEECLLENLGETLLKKGIIFVGGGLEKGPVLLGYLKKLSKMPERIVAVDDRLNHLESIAEAIEPLGIDFIGIRYGKTDEKVKAYNPKIAAIQWERLHKILSDEEALHLMKINP